MAGVDRNRTEPRPPRDDFTRPGNYPSCMAKFHPPPVSPRHGQAGKRSDAILVPEEHSMQRIVITAVLAASFAGAFADELPALATDSFVSTKTRAQVQTELAQYQKAGVNPWSISYNPLKDFSSAKTRTEVTAEYLASRDEVHAFTSEDSGSEWLRVAAHPASAARSLASN